MQERILGDAAAGFRARCGILHVIHSEDHPLLCFVSISGYTCVVNECVVSEWYNCLIDSTIRCFEHCEVILLELCNTVYAVQL